MEKTALNRYPGPPTPIRWIPALNVDSQLCPPGGACVVVGVDTATASLKIQRVGTSGQVAGVFFNGLAPISPGGYGQITETVPAVAAYQSDVTQSGDAGQNKADPVAGEVWGTQASSWYLQANQPGFFILGGAYQGLANVTRDVPPFFAWVKITSTTKTSSRYPGQWSVYNPSSNTFTDQGISTAFTGNTSSGSAAVTSCSETGLLNVGDPVTGTGIPANAVILSIDSTTQITLSANATANGTGVSLTATHGVWVVPPNSETLSLSTYYNARNYGCVNGVTVYKVTAIPGSGGGTVGPGSFPHMAMFFGTNTIGDSHFIESQYTTGGQTYFIDIPQEEFAFVAAGGNLGSFPGGEIDPIGLNHIGYGSGSGNLTSVAIHADYLGVTYNRVLMLVNATGGALTIKHESASATSASYRIWCPGAADYTWADKSGVILVYCAPANRWVMMGHT